MFRRIVLNFNRIAAALDKKSQQESAEVTQYIVGNLEQRSRTTKVFAYESTSTRHSPQRVDGHLTMDTDTCNIQIECVPLQLNKRKPRVQ